jgi:hypothetical protein
MNQTKRRTGTARVTPVPNWISDKENQRIWNDRFIRILERDYVDLDTTICAVLSNERLSNLCATQIRTYVDRDVTLALNEQRKARGIELKLRIETAIARLQAASEFDRGQGDNEAAVQSTTRVDELSRVLGRFKVAFGTKRLGRDRDHSVLYYFRRFLESQLQQSVTNVTLANLVSAGFEADQSEAFADEEQIRKNLAYFERTNPHLLQLLESPGA